MKKLVEENKKSLSFQEQELINQIFANEEKNIKIEEFKLIIDKNKALIEDCTNNNKPNNNKESKKIAIFKRRNHSRLYDIYNSLKKSNLHKKIIIFFN